ncbi:heme anaerobic degradation radical SAM methyltransferase ChuW/HutW [Wenzhouxiangella sp. XN24]|uniref:heme anaerobic degradation radical SAM methyltransferase ChuW/HutW n=1 Tax=Wenzhouxiangella sp. XN24 TaxID=2713569 RepID=UPI0013E9EDB4|nr:heme anaerobic degradation radical SAM methyltransferase ChuW/HutW [Wenzhouxiangella sp. XN24]NGX16359.1 heme anaerobic degradation radical SAM methyltransferase ChuW/HutW [Wenzhouxiangella sp. XN24]
MPADLAEALAGFMAATRGDPLRSAFSDVRRAHPGGLAAPVPAEEFEAHWAVMSQSPRSGPGTAYVHVPFCETHCLFCGFYKYHWRKRDGAPYVDSVLTQARRLQGLPLLDGPPLRALYLGGGTPTILAAPDLHRLVSELRALLPLAPDCEITLEGRILAFTEDKMRAAFDAGVNRVSLGVQTFDEPVRHSLGRKAGRQAVIATLEKLVALDCGAIVIDLIYGLPGQSFETWAEDLRLVEAIGLDGVDLYGLNLIPGTPLTTAIDKRKLDPVPRQDLGVFYAAGAEAMEQAGWEAISTSHWRSPSLRERSVYNYLSKTGAECIAFGAGAGGALGGVGYRLTPTVDAYARQLDQGQLPITNMFRARPDAALVNMIRAGMERGRLDSARVRAAPGGEAAMDDLEPLLAHWSRAGLMVRRQRFFDLTVAGRFWQVAMTQRIIGFLDHPQRQPMATLLLEEGEK